MPEFYVKQSIGSKTKYVLANPQPTSQAQILGTTPTYYARTRRTVQVSSYRKALASDVVAQAIVQSINAVDVTEGGALVFTVLLNKAVVGSALVVPASVTGVTLSGLTYSNGVTLSGSSLTVPIGVSSFTATLQTTDDAVANGTRTYTLVIGGISETGNVLDNDSVVNNTVGYAPNIYPDNYYSGNQVWLDLQHKVSFPETIANSDGWIDSLPVGQSVNSLLIESNQFQLEQVIRPGTYKIVDVNSTGLSMTVECSEVGLVTVVSQVGNTLTFTVGTLSTYKTFVITQRLTNNTSSAIALNSGSLVCYDTRDQAGYDAGYITSKIWRDNMAKAVAFRPMDLLATNNNPFGSASELPTKTTKGWGIAPIETVIEAGLELEIYHNKNIEIDLTIPDFAKPQQFNIDSNAITVPEGGVNNPIPHGLNNGDRVYIFAGNATARGLFGHVDGNHVIFYVRNKTARGFEVSTTANGAILSLSNQTADTLGYAYFAKVQPLYDSLFAIAQKVAAVSKTIGGVTKTALQDLKFNIGSGNEKWNTGGAAFNPAYNFTRCVLSVLAGSPGNLGVGYAYGLCVLDKAFTDAGFVRGANYYLDFEAQHANPGNLGSGLNYINPYNNLPVKNICKRYRRSTYMYFSNPATNVAVQYGAYPFENGVTAGVATMTDAELGRWMQKGIDNEVNYAVQTKAFLDATAPALEYSSYEDGIDLAVQTSASYTPTQVANINAVISRIIAFLNSEYHTLLLAERYKRLVTDFNVKLWTQFQDMGNSAYADATRVFCFMWGLKSTAWSASNPYWDFVTNIASFAFANDQIESITNAGDVSEGQNALFTINLTPSSSPRFLHYTLGGTAQSTDYGLVSSPTAGVLITSKIIKVPANTNSVQVAVAIVNDVEAEDVEILTLSANNITSAVNIVFNDGFNPALLLNMNTGVANETSPIATWGLRQLTPSVLGQAAINLSMANDDYVALNAHETPSFGSWAVNAQAQFEITFNFDRVLASNGSSALAFLIVHRNGSQIIKTYGFGTATEIGLTVNNNDRQGSQAIANLDVNTTDDIKTVLTLTNTGSAAYASGHELNIVLLAKTAFGVTVKNVRKNLATKVKAMPSTR